MRHVQSALGVSERRACRTLGQPRSTQRKVRVVRSDEAALTEAVVSLPAGMPPAERQRRADAMLEEVGLGGFGARFPHALSGGQRKRVAIARALVRDPAFVVADEAVSALDATVRKQVLALLREQQRRRGFACLFVTHDLGVVEEIADRIIVMQNGRIVEQGPRDAVLDAPAHGYTQALLAAALRRPGSA